jgi:hypothetical protein
LLDDN